MKKKAKNLQKGTFEVLTKTHLLKIKGGILYPNPPTNPTGPARNH